MLGFITCIFHNQINLINLYKQFNFGLAPQTFGLVTSSNSLPEGQPRLFIFVSPYKYCEETTELEKWQSEILSEY